METNAALRVCAEYLSTFDPMFVPSAERMRVWNRVRRLAWEYERKGQYAQAARLLADLCGAQRDAHTHRSAGNTPEALRAESRQGRILRSFKL